MSLENGQPESSVFFQYLDACCQLIGEKTGNAHIAEWTNGDYVRLSSRLAHETDVQISPNTLKRIFGKLKTSSRYYPQKATRDALARFAGYLHWDDFMAKYPLPVKPVDTTPVSVQKEVTVQRSTFNYIPWAAGAGVLIILLAAYFSFFYSSGTKKLATHVRLICNNPSGENPHSAVFQLSNTEDITDADQLTVYFGDNKFATIRPNSLAVHYYEMPGRYYAVLKNHDIPLDTLPIYLESNGWNATATLVHDTTRVYPINKNEPTRNGNIMVTTNDVYHAGGDTNRTFLVHFTNAKPLHINGDNFELVARVKTSQPRPGVRCSQVYTQVFGDRAKHSFLVMKAGCASFMQLQFSEIFMDGQSHDLRNVAVDFTHGGEYRLLVRNQEARIIINGKEVFSTTYKQPLGELFGLRISFSGIGEIDHLYLKDLNTGVLFHDGFSMPGKLD